MDKENTPVVTIDGVLFRFINMKLHVLLLQREKDPFRAKWALPGGYITRQETSRQALNRVLSTKTPISPAAFGYVEQLYTFDTQALQGGNAISVVYFALCRSEEDKAKKGTWHPVNELPSLAYEHDAIVRYALERLQSKVMYSNVLFALLPEFFTLPQLQEAYEAVLGQKLDKRNFRKKILALELLQETSKRRRQGAHRPAKLYKFAQPRLQTLSRSFG